MISQNKITLGVVAIALIGVGSWWLFGLQYNQSQMMNATIATTSVPSSTPFTEKDLVGNWEDQLNNQQLDFKKEGGGNILNSFVDGRPEYIDCPWALVGATVSVNCPTIQDSFTIVSLSAANMLIDREGVQFTYQRIPK